MISGCKRLVTLEQRLEQGQPIYDAMPGLGPDHLASLLPVEGRCPPRLPEFLAASLAANALSLDVDLYKRLRSLVTPTGVGLATCIRPAVDAKHLGANGLCTGLVAGDKACLDTFYDLFQAVIQQIPKSPFFEQKLQDASPHCLWVKADLRRNIDGLRYAPCCSLDERREAERLLVHALANCKVIDTNGSYLPLASSTSFWLKPNGMDPEQQQHLSSTGLLFAEPYDPCTLAAGIGRHWPDARGLFLAPMEDASPQQLAVWINEQDHLRLRLCCKGSDLSALCDKVASISETIETELKQHSAYRFACHDVFSHVTVDSKHLGSGLQLSAALALPLLSSRADFGNISARLGVTISWIGNVLEVTTRPVPAFSSEEVLKHALGSFGMLVALESAVEQGLSVHDILIANGLKG